MALLHLNRHTVGFILGVPTALSIGPKSSLFSLTVEGDMRQKNHPTIGGTRYGKLGIEPVAIWVLKEDRHRKGFIATKTRDVEVLLSIQPVSGGGKAPLQLTVAASYRDPERIADIEYVQVVLSDRAADQGGGNGPPKTRQSGLG
ncbi:hypothetical protein C8J57DRAFT_1468659 [Mycena rebaudengoi]|nr:hypothetical protein C8J57DRAFT_1468659 [Mycena rebaudengoi]